MSVVHPHVAFVVVPPVVPVVLAVVHVVWA